jgi:hypothetical protein
MQVKMMSIKDDHINFCKYDNMLLLDIIHLLSNLRAIDVFHSFTNLLKRALNLLKPATHSQINNMAQQRA